MEKHLYIDCTLIKNHPDCNAYMDYLVDHHFIHNVENLPHGILPFAFPFGNDDYIGYIFNNLCVQTIAVPDENDESTDMAVLVNMDGTRIELLINADGNCPLPTANTIANTIARNALVKYLEQLDFGKSDDYVVFHLGEVLKDAYQENGEEHQLPSGRRYVVVDTPFHGDIIKNILNNISIHRHDKNIEKVITEALGITREQAKFDHVFYPDTKSADDADDNDETIYDTNFTYRSEGFTLTITSYEKGYQKIEVQGYPTDQRERAIIPDIHDLKSIIDKTFLNDAPVEAPKVEPVETPKEEPEAEPEEAPKVDADILVSIKANTYIEAFTKKQAEVISRTAKGEDWFAEFNEIASPKEVVGYYFYTYGILKALKWWKKNSEKSERTEFDEDVDEIFDSIFCPFCKQGKPVKFDSSNDMYLKRCDLHDNKVDCYAQGDSYVGTMVFPNCPLCGDKLSKD